MLLTKASETLPAGTCGQPMLLNAGAAGYFRVAYDPATAKALSEQIEQLQPPDRVRLLSDTSAAMFAGSVPPGPTWISSRVSGDDQNIAVLEAIMSVRNVMANIEEARPGETAFDSYQRALFRPAFDRIGWDAQPGEAPTVASLALG